MPVSPPRRGASYSCAKQLSQRTGPSRSAVVDHNHDRDPAFAHEAETATTGNVAAIHRPDFVDVERYRAALT